MEKDFKNFYTIQYEIDQIATIVSKFLYPINL
jgi:hypothetical protein